LFWDVCQTARGSTKKKGRMKKALNAKVRHGAAAVRARESWGEGEPQGGAKEKGGKRD